MGADDDHDWAAQLAAAQAWWREAGVDMAFDDKPRNWLTASAGPEVVVGTVPKTPVRPEAAPRPPVPRIGGDRARWPATLAAFTDWWLTEPSLDPAGLAHRVPPAGPAGAPLMVLVPQPEEDDRASLLSGEQGRLLDAILAAFGYAREQVYLASVLPRPAALVDWAALTGTGMSEIVAHHVALAAPDRLLVFGRGGVSALLGHDPAQAASTSLLFNHDGGSVPLAFGPSLETLLERPALKQGVWTRWLDWTQTA
jgi:DNA polymerase